MLSISCSMLFLFLRYLFFVLTFWLYRNTAYSLIRKLRLTSEFVMSQTGQEILTINILSKFSRRRGNQAMKFCK